MRRLDLAERSTPVTRPAARGARGEQRIAAVARAEIEHALAVADRRGRVHVADALHEARRVAEKVELLVGVAHLLHQAAVDHRRRLRRAIVIVGRDGRTARRGVVVCRRELALEDIATRHRAVLCQK